MMEGAGSGTALIVFFELGGKADAFPTIGHFASWPRLRPAASISGGKILGKSARKADKRTAAALRMRASSLCALDSALGGFLTKMKHRREP